MASLFGRGFNPLHLHKKAQLRLCFFGWNGWIEPDYFLFLLPLHLHQKRHNFGCAFFVFMTTSWDWKRLLVRRNLAFFVFRQPQ